MKSIQLLLEVIIECVLDYLATLEYEINVPVRLLISEIFSHRYALISDGTFIEIRIFRNSMNFFGTFGIPLCKVMIGM